MRYENMIEARFVSRPNRFIAYCDYEGTMVTAHVRNTGRCRELLLPGATVFLGKAKEPSRKTQFSLITVVKNGRYVNIDSTAPNKVFCEALKKNPSLLEELGPVTLIRSEARFENSRFDFYLEAGPEKAFVEVKGVTLEENNLALFPDAPTERGIKHMKELIKARAEGYGAYIIFIVQMKGVSSFSPNIKTHPQFGKVLKEAQETGVSVLCFDCNVGKNYLSFGDPIPVEI